MYYRSNFLVLVGGEAQPFSSPHSGLPPEPSQ